MRKGVYIYPVRHGPVGDGGGGSLKKGKEKETKIKRDEYMRKKGLQNRFKADGRNGTKRNWSGWAADLASSDDQSDDDGGGIIEAVVDRRSRAPIGATSRHGGGV